MKRWFIPLLTVIVIGSACWSLSPAAAQTGKSHTKTASKTHKSKKAVFVCTACKSYFTAAQAKKMGYKDPEGHKLVKKSSVPTGYMDGSKMDHKM